MLKPVRIAVSMYRILVSVAIGMTLTALLAAGSVGPSVVFNSVKALDALLDVVDPMVASGDGIAVNHVAATSDSVAPPSEPALAPSQKIQRMIASQSIQRDSPYLVYLPPDYDLNTDRQYPVLYMLHGVGGNDPTGEFWEWEDDQLLFTQADPMIRMGEIQSMIIVLPQGEDSYFVNHADGGPQWGDFVARELVRDVDANFRTLPYREARAVGGLSMGGQAALQLGMNYPEVFSIVGAHSPTIREVSNRPWYMGDEAYYRDYDPVSLVKDKPDVARTLNIWLDVGNADEVWKPVVDGYAQLLRDLDIPFTYASFNGEHHGDYWEASVPEYLRFYNRAFRQNLTASEL